MAPKLTPTAAVARAANPAPKGKHRGSSSSRVPGASKAKANARGRKLLRGSSEDAPDEADIEVTVCLQSGEERLRAVLPAQSTVAALRKVLIDDGETEYNLNFSFMGEMIDDSDVICTFNGFESGAIVHMTRFEGAKKQMDWAEWRDKEILEGFLRQSGFWGFKPRRTWLFRTYPLHAAARQNDLQAVQLLLKSGANPRVVDYRGRSPKQIAMKYDAAGSHVDVIKWLETAESHTS